MKRNTGIILTFGIIVLTIALDFVPNAALEDLIFSTASYIVIAILLWIEINHLEDFHFDRFSLVIFVVFGTILRRRFGVAGEIYFMIATWTASLSILATLLFKRQKVTATNYRWLWIGLITSLPIMLIVVVLTSKSPLIPGVSWMPYPSNNLVLASIREIVYRFSFVAPLEETIFRGFLWGYLHRLGWDEHRTFWAQAVLFWVLHFPKLFYSPIQFFIVIPIITLFFSLLVKYSKQLLPSIIGHTIINAIGPVVQYAYFK